MKRLYKKVVSLSFIYSLGNILQKGISIFLIPIYTTYLIPKDYGILALMTITMSILTSFISSPVNTALLRYYYKPGHEKDKDVLLFNLFIFTLIQALAIGAIYYLFSKKATSILFNDANYINVLKFYTFILILNPVESYLLSYLRLIEKAKFCVTIFLTRFVFSTTVILVLLIKFHSGIYALIWGEIVSSFYTVLLCLPIFIKKVKYKIALSTIKEPLKYAYPQLIASYSNIIMQSGDRYVLKYLSSVKNVGLYSFGYRIAGIINVFLIYPLKQGLEPIVYQKEGNPEKQKLFLRKLATHYYLFGISLALALSIFSKEIIMILARNKAFWSSWTVVPAISFSYVLHGLGIFLGKGMVMKNKSFHVSAILLISGIMNIVLNFILIPIYGISGAAMATLIAYILWNWLKIYYSNKFYGLYFETDRLLYITAVAAVSFLCAIFIASTDILIYNLLIKSLFLLSFPTILYLTGFFTHNEKKYIMKIVRVVSHNSLTKSFMDIKKNDNDHMVNPP